MEGLNHKRSRSPPKVGDHSSTSDSSTRPCDALIDSATNEAVILQMSPINSDNGGPSSGPRITSASSLQCRMTSLSSPHIPSDSAHYGKHTMPDIQGDIQILMQNRMAIEFILNRNAPHSSGFPDPLKTVDDSTAVGKQSGSTASATQKMERCGCDLSGFTMQNLEKHCLIYLDRIKFSEESIRNTKAGLSIDKWKQESQQASHRLAHLVQHQENLMEEAKQSSLELIAHGTSSTLFEIPESFGSLVLKVGPREKMIQERQNNLLVAQALEKMGTSIGNISPKSSLKSLLLPTIEKPVLTGFEEDSATGLLRPCTSLDSRIPDSCDTNSDRMLVDSDDQVGIVMARIGDLSLSSRNTFSRKCSHLIGLKLDKALVTNEHCCIRIHLGQSSDDENSDDSRDSASDATMNGADEQTSVTTLDDESFSTWNLPACFEHVFEACNRSRGILQKFPHEIALGYAILHWGAHLDGRGIEFLLGLSPTGFERLYMLDFEDCRPIEELTAACVREQLVPAALENDPYIPRAISGSSDEKVWWQEGDSWYSAYTSRSHKVWVSKAFQKHYLEASAKILEAYDRDSESDLPRIFINELEKRMFQQDAERSVNGGLDLEDATHDRADQGERDNQEESESDGGDDGDQIQSDYQFSENESDAMETDDSEEGEEYSEEDSEEDSEDEDDDDLDDVD